MGEWVCRTSGGRNECKQPEMEAGAGRTDSRKNQEWHVTATLCIKRMYLLFQKLGASGIPDIG